MVICEIAMLHCIHHCSCYCVYMMFRILWDVTCAYFASVIHLQSGVLFIFYSSVNSKQLLRHIRVSIVCTLLLVLLTIPLSFMVTSCIRFTDDYEVCTDCLVFGSLVYICNVLLTLPTYYAEHTHTRLTALFPGLPRWAGTRTVKPIWILLKQETVSGSGISWAICKSALPPTQPTASKHWRHTCNQVWNETESLLCESSTFEGIYNLSWLVQILTIVII